MNEAMWTDEVELAAFENRGGEPRTVPPEEAVPAVLAWQAERPLDLAFPADADEAARTRWRDATRRWLRGQLAWPEPTAPLDVDITRRIERDGYIEEHLTFTGAPPLRVPATVLTPTVGQGPFPAVLALHDMGGMRAFGREKLLSFDGEPRYLTDFRQANYEGASIMRDLVRRGYVVMAIDAANFGERTPAALRDAEAFARDRLAWDMEDARAFSRSISFTDEPALVRQVMSVGRTWPGLVVTDDLRSLDYLAQRPDVDATRIGCAGLSFGAYRANYLAALDERVAATVSVCWTSAMEGVVGYNVVGAMGWFSLVPGMFARMDLPDLQALAAPRPFMAISGWHDVLMRPVGLAVGHRQLRRAWSAWGAPERLGSLVYDCPHEFNRAMQQAAWQWLDRWLKRS